MLEFIVLGRIPGSQLQITFAGLIDFICLVVCIYLTLLVIKSVHRRHLTNQPMAQPAPSLRHTGAALRARIARAKIHWIHLLIGPSVR